MICIYDGSIEGLFTLIFDKYREIEKILRIDTEENQLNLWDDKEVIKTDLEKAKKVYKALRRDFSYNFILNLSYCFLSNSKRKEIIMARVIKKLYQRGESYLDSADKDMLQFNELVKNILRERHRYLGLLRFSEISGGFLYGEFEPANNILPLIMSHFQHRLSCENFAICDVRRRIVGIYEKGDIGYYEMEEVEFIQEGAEEEYKNLWRTFYNTIAIENRKNSKLKQSNMPKKYWKFLPEII